MSPTEGSAPAGAPLLRQLPGQVADLLRLRVVRQRQRQRQHRREVAGRGSVVQRGRHCPILESEVDLHVARRSGFRFRWRLRLRWSRTILSFAGYDAERHQQHQRDDVGSRVHGRPVHGIVIPPPTVRACQSLTPSARPYRRRSFARPCSRPARLPGTGQSWPICAICLASMRPP
jgi:hypothetical protein